MNKIYKSLVCPNKIHKCAQAIVQYLNTFSVIPTFDASGLLPIPFFDFLIDRNNMKRIHEFTTPLRYPYINIFCNFFLMISLFRSAK